MNFKAGLWQHQTLKLAMTQELSQAIALLQYSAQELTDFLESKALENPLITIFDAPNRNLKKRPKSEKKETSWIEQIADEKKVSLEEQLLTQLNVNKYSKVQLAIIKELIQNLDENGYFRGDIKEISNKRNVHAQIVEESLTIIQGLDPAGIGARSLQECLLIQLTREKPVNELALTIIDQFFVLFAEKKWKVLSKQLQVPLKEIQDVFDKIQKLDPRPASVYSNDLTSYIVPDAIIDITSMGISVQLKDSAVPKICFNEPYYKKFSMSEDKQVNRFLQEKLQDYQWIMKSIEQRRITLERVIIKLTEKQSDYFRKGPKYLNPMTMKELALALDVHESTISRAVREKYVQTPFGTIPLKSFFSSTIQTISEDNASSSQVKNALFQLIENENKLDPLSDQEIVSQLKNKEGIVISRRTVAKYRDQLGIASSSKRKRY